MLLADFRVFCDIIVTVRLFLTGFLSLFLFSNSLFSGVVQNPFLRPSPNVPSNKVLPLPPPKPTKKINPNLSKEVEFKGYFIYRGDPFFCVFNKKTKRGEWIQLNEKTYEEFQAHSFDLEKESLTLRFNNQDIVLTLEKSKFDFSSPSNTSRISTPKSNNYSSNTQGNSSSKPAVMPPRPKTRPELPERISSSRTSQRTPAIVRPQTSTSSSVSSFPVLPPFSSSSVVSRGSVQAKSPIISNAQPGRMSNRSIQIPNFSSNSPSSSTSGLVNSGSGLEQSEQSDGVTIEDELDNLPPPPPPPRIFPPGPPPNIIPAER